MEVLRNTMADPSGVVGTLTTYETNGRLTTKPDENSVSPGSMSGKVKYNIDRLGCIGGPMISSFICYSKEVIANFWHFQDIFVVKTHSKIRYQQRALLNSIVIAPLSLCNWCYRQLILNYCQVIW